MLEPPTHHGAQAQVNCELLAIVTLGSFDYALTRFAQDDGGATTLLVLTFGHEVTVTAPVRMHRCMGFTTQSQIRDATSSGARKRNNNGHPPPRGE